MEHQDPSLCYSKAVPRRLEMAGENLLLADSLVGEETVSGLGAGPVLAGHGNGFADSFGEPFQQGPEPLSQTHVRKSAFRQFTVQPGCHYTRLHNGVLMRC